LALCLAASDLAQQAVAQCDTCASPTVAYQPVQPVAVAVTQQRSGWYPGRLLDRLRMRSWGTQPAATPTYAAPSYSAPAYTAAYAPSTYTAAYAPTPYTASYTPYVTAYAPLQRTTALYRPVALRPVIADTGCSTCSYTPAMPCSDCGVSQATFSEPVGGCSNCEASSGSPSYAYEQGGYEGGDSWRGSDNYSGGATPDPATPQPSLKPQAAPESSYYRGESLASARDLAALRDRIDQLERERDEYTSKYRHESEPQEREESILRKIPAEAEDYDSGFPGKFDPDKYNPETDEADSDARSGAPSWRLPTSNQTARAPSVSVWNAVYKRSASRSQQVSNRRSVSKQPTQAEIDAQGWRAVRRNR